MYICLLPNLTTTKCMTVDLWATTLTETCLSETFCRRDIELTHIDMHTVHKCDFQEYFVIDIKSILTGELLVLAWLVIV